MGAFGFGLMPPDEMPVFDLELPHNEARNQCEVAHVLSDNLEGKM
jgi:hypothetical protein